MVGGGGTSVPGGPVGFATPWHEMQFVPYDPSGRAEAELAKKRLSPMARPMEAARVKADLSFMRFSRFS